MDKEKSAFYGKLLSLALPIMAQNLLSSAVSFLDTLMIGQLGEVEIAAVGIGNQVFFLANLFVFGIASGAVIFLAQQYGAGRHDEMRKTMGFALIVTSLGTFLWAFASLMFPSLISRLFTDSESVISLSSTYQRIVAPSYIFYGISQLHAFAFRSTGEARLPLLSSLFAVVFNGVFNYLLIFGIGPFPTLGVGGAAISTLVSRFLDMTILIWATYKREMPFRISSDSFSLTSAFIRTYLRTSTPVLLNEVLWSIGMTLYKMAYGCLGVDALAVVNIVEGIYQLAFVAGLGIANASAVILGQTLGVGDEVKAKTYCRRSLILSFILGIAETAIMIAASAFAPLFFNVSDEVRHMTTLTIIACSLIMPLKNSNTTSIVGVFRSGGDTMFSLLSECCCVWLIGVPMAFFGAVVLKWPIYLVYVLVNLEETGKFFVSMPRIISGKWIRRITQSEN